MFSRIKHKTTANLYLCVQCSYTTRCAPCTVVKPFLVLFLVKQVTRINLKTRCVSISVPSFEKFRSFHWTWPFSLGLLVFADVCVKRKTKTNIEEEEMANRNAFVHFKRWRSPAKSRSDSGRSSACRNKTSAHILNAMNGCALQSGSIAAMMTALHLRLEYCWFSALHTMGIEQATLEPPTIDRHSTATEKCKFNAMLPAILPSDVVYFSNQTRKVNPDERS